MLRVEQPEHRAFLDHQQGAGFHGGRRGDAHRLGGQAPFPEEVARTRHAEVLECFLDRHLDVLRRELVGRIERIDPFEHGDHLVAAGAREREACALFVELGKQGRGGHGS